MDFLKKNSKVIALIGCGLMLIGCFLPFAKVTISLLGISKSESINFIDGDGIFVIICAVVAAVLICLKKPKITLIPAVIGLGVTVYDMVNAGAIIKKAALTLGEISFGIGCWIILIGCICAISYAFLHEDGFLASKMNK